MSTSVEREPAGPDERAHPGWVRRHKRALIIVGQLVALILVTWLLVVPQLHGAGKHLSLLLHPHSGWVAFALASEIASLLFYALVTRSMLAPKLRPPFFRIARIDLSSIAIGHCVPDGGTAGTALCWRLLVKSGVPTADAGIAKMAQGLTSAIVLQALVLAGILFGYFTGGYTRWATLPMVAAASVLVVTVLALLSIRHPAVRGWLRRALSAIPRFGTRLARGVDTLQRREVLIHFRSMWRRPVNAVWPLAYASANWSFDMLTMWLCLRAYGANVGVIAIATIYSIQTIGAWIPITPGGLGVAESVMIPALIAFGAPGTGAVLGLITWRLIAFWLPIPLGALAYGSLALDRPRPA